MTKTTLTALINNPGNASKPGEQIYVFRDDEVVFYVGQTQMAGAARAYEHWCGGFRANDRLQEFLRAALDDGLDVAVEFWSVDDCKAIDIEAEIYDAEDAEQLLIDLHCPIFNTAGMSKNPAETPTKYIGYHAMLQERQERIRVAINRLERSIANASS